MASVLIEYDEDVPVMMGDIPPDARTPVRDPVATGYTTNQPCIVQQGDYCFCIQTDSEYEPLWQTVQAVDGVDKKIAFRKVA